MATTTDPTNAELVERFASLRVDRDNAEFYRGWLAHELRMNRCADCGHWHHPPRPLCPACWSWNLMLLRQGPAAPGVDYSAGPHPVVTVELEEQPHLRYTSTIVNLGGVEPAIGMPVTLTWIERGGAPFPVFEPATDALTTETEAAR
jgi:uncharacterized OB-fold protein